MKSNHDSAPSDESAPRIDVASSETIGPDPHWSRLQPVILLSAVAFLLGGNCSARIVPGGPFISILSDIIPAIAAIVAMGKGLVAMRCKPAWPKLIAFVCILVATIGLAHVIIDVYMFWNRPHARGALIGL